MNKWLQTYLNTYTTYEHIYKQRYSLLTSKHALEEYIASLDYEYIKNNLLLIPEKLTNRFRIENDIIYQNEPLSLTIEQPDILIEKHPRYMSEFWHNHVFFEVLYMYNGSCISRFNDSSFTMHTGDICIIAPRISHSIGIFDDSILLNIQIKPQVFQQSLLDLLHTESLLSIFITKALTEDIYNPYILFHMPEYLPLKTSIESAALEYFSPTNYANNFITSYIHLFFSHCLRYEAKEIILADSTKNNLKKIGTILDYIKQNYQEITLHELALKFHYTYPYISKLIKDYTGNTFIQLLQAIRLEQSASLLIRTQKNIPDIAYACGYESAEHFIRIFHKKYGISPLQYRKKNLL